MNGASKITFEVVLERDRVYRSSMIFVPLPLFATFFLGFALARFVFTRDMRKRPHQLFATLIALFGVQSLLTSLRWGYGVEAVAPLMGLIAPVLPVLAYLAYAGLSGRQRGRQLWPLAVVVLNWIVFFALDDFADLPILLTYLSFGALLLWRYRRGEGALSLPPLSDARDIRTAMGLTGIALIASGLTDAYIVYDYITADGRTAGRVLSVAQTVFILMAGILAVFGKAAEDPGKAASPPAPAAKAATETDEAILEQLDRLFEGEKLHRTEDLSLRRLSRRLGVSDRQVSSAINRIKKMSVSQYVNAFRIEEACRLLRETDDSVLTISLASGFATKSNFNREFSRVTGQAPTQWRDADKRARRVDRGEG